MSATVHGWSAPSVEVPFWRDPSGRRATVQGAAASRSAAERRALLELHADAVCALVHAAAEHRLRGEAVAARRLASHASRLCGELAGLWPAGSESPLA